MMMFLTILLWSVLILAVSAAVFGKATREAPRPEVRPALEPVLGAPRFFAGAAAPPPAAPQLPVEVLLSQIERHVRLEQAAVESFLNGPTAESLYTKTSSPLLN